MKRIIFLLSSFILLFCLVSCSNNNTYDFVIYEPDINNLDLSDNKEIKRFTISYDEDAKYVSDTLIKKNTNVYKFQNNTIDYLILEEDTYGLYYKYAFFSSYELCEHGQIDITDALLMVDGVKSDYYIGNLEVSGVKEVSLVLNGNISN